MTPNEQVLDQVIADIAAELGCEPDNEAVLERIRRLRAQAADEIEHLREKLRHAAAAGRD